MNSPCKQITAAELQYSEAELQKRSDLRIKIVADYISNLPTTFDFPGLHSAQWLHPHRPSDWEAELVASFKKHLQDTRSPGPGYLNRTNEIVPFKDRIDNLEKEPHIVGRFKRELKEVFQVPRLDIFHQSHNPIIKSHLLQAFLSFLLQLLYHKTDPIVDPFKDGIDNLEKELRYLLTILGDISWMLCHDHVHDAQFRNFFPQFEAVANQAGSFVRNLFFSVDRSVDETDEGLASALKHIDILKANLQLRLCIPAYTTPTTSTLDSLLILHSLIDDLEDLLKREDDSIAEAKDQINLLHHELLLSHSSIKDMRLPQPSEIEEVKESLTRIGGIAHQADYLITSFLVEDAPLWYVINRLTDLTHRIQTIRTELQLNVAEYISAELPLHDKINTEVNSVTVGFEDKTTEILDQLIGGATKSLQVISILGMPGLGKTTLANKLYNHPSVSDRFDKFAWCVVSQTYKTQNILAKILIHINSELRKDSILSMEEIELVEHIHKTLIGRRYIIVLDDIWDSNILDELLRCFPEDRNGSRILFTSRNKDVAPPNSIKHELPFLTNEQCWELLENKTFGTLRTCPPQLRGIGKQIAARCCGLPLTVVVIAGVLSTVDEEERKWLEVRRNLGSYIDGENNSVMQILDLSYKYLPDHLKPCFLYFGGFEEDERISVGNLKRLWVAEGFIRQEKDKSAETIAGEYLMELIDKSLVMVAKRTMAGRGAKRCVVHDLLHDLCLKKCEEESFLRHQSNSFRPISFEKGHRVRNHSTVANGYPTNCQHVRSYFCNYGLNLTYFRDMRLLRVLYILERQIFGIEYLVNLRFLVICNMPTWIERLVNLEYLRLEKREIIYTISRIPPAIVKMKKLRYLSAGSAKYGKDWNISSQTNNLECLAWVNIKKVKDEELLKCSPHLRKLKCCYYVDEKRPCPHFDLRFLTHLHSLTLEFKFIFWEKVPAYPDLGFPDFGFPSNIRKLTLMHSCFCWEKMSIVGKLKFLEVLKLRSVAFRGKRWDTREGEFQKLRFLQFYNLFHLSEWNVDSSEHFPKLQQLILSDCENLEEIPSEIGEITTLELIEVKGRCSSSLEKSAERIREEQRDMGNEELKVIISYGNHDDM